MSSNVFTILTILFGVIGTVLAFSEEISLKYKRLKIINQVWFKIILVVIIAILSYLITIIRQKSADNELTLGQNKRDSAAEVKRLESNKELVNSFGKAIGEYKLHYDSTNNELKDIIKRDTSNKTVNINYGQDPDFDVCTEKGIQLIDYRYNDYDKNYLYHIHINFCDKLSTSININFQVYLVGVNQKNIYVFIDTVRSSIPKISVGDTSAITETYIVSGSGGSLRSLFYIVKGDFYNSNNKKLNFYSFLMYDFYRNENSVPNDKLKAEVRAVLKVKNIKL